MAEMREVVACVIFLCVISGIIFFVSMDPGNYGYP